MRACLGGCLQCCFVNASTGLGVEYLRGWVFSLNCEDVFWGVVILKKEGRSFLGSDFFGISISLCIIQMGG